MRRKREMDGSSGAEGGFGSSSANRHNQVVKDDLYGELWRACAGPCVYVPRAGEKVLYFPQGHLEQVAAVAQHQLDGQLEIPVYDLPSKILCRVMCVQLKAEPYTDEVFAQVTLIPEPRQDDLNLERNGNCQIPQRTRSYSFSKILTPSDTSTHGGFSIPKRHADECFRPLDMTQQPPTQELVAKDLHGVEWHFRQIYRGQPKRHLITSGWSTFVNSKKLVAGDTCIFVSGENGDLRIGIRRATRQHSNPSTSSSLISGHSMQLGILASASHAVATGSMFTVYYRPWTNPFEFIVPLKNYIKSTEVDYTIGMRVLMLFEIEEAAKRYVGTIIGIEDIDHFRWPGSDWRRLKVQWDAILDTFTHPERVCAWWIEPMEPSKDELVSLPPQSNKACVLNPPLPGLRNFANGTVPNSAGAASQGLVRGLQGQDYNGIGSSQPLQKSLGSSMSFTHEDFSTSSSIANFTGSESHGWPSSESKDENDVPFGQPGTSRTCKLFGFNLIDSHSELPSPQFAALSKTSSILSSPPMYVTSEKACRKCRFNTRSCIKVGTALGRAIYLARFPGYDELISELDSMFDFGGSLIGGSSGWHVTCIDDDGDMMLLGDYPWQDFQSMVQKIIICPRDGAINNLTPSSSAYPTSFEF